MVTLKGRFYGSKLLYRTGPRLGSKKNLYFTTLINFRQVSPTATRAARASEAEPTSADQHRAVPAEAQHRAADLRRRQEPDQPLRDLRRSPEQTGVHG